VQVCAITCQRIINCTLFKITIKIRMFKDEAWAGPEVMEKFIKCLYVNLLNFV
jgi:hypothetical protein